MIPEFRAVCWALTSGGAPGLSLLVLVGCGGTRAMMPTPNVHLDRERDFYAELHRELKSTEVPLFYVTDLRELTIAARAAGLDPREEYKIHNLVLAAPDLDLQVATQRIVGDQLPLSVHRLPRRPARVSRPESGALDRYPGWPRSSVRRLAVGS